MNLSEIRKNQIVSLSIPFSSPIKTLDGNLHEGGQQYKVLGVYAASFARLSRTSDKAKLIIDPDKLTLVKQAHIDPDKLQREENGRKLREGLAKLNSRQSHWTNMLND